MDAIADRRSIRQFRDTPVPRELVEEVLRAGLLAPSSKNRQPWGFTVVSGAAKRDMLAAMKRGLERERRNPFLPGSSQFLAGAENTWSIMGQAPVTVFVLNVLGLPLGRPLTEEERVYELCNAQSIGAAVENMTLRATELGLGSLWICDTYFAQKELADWLVGEGVLTAALALGYADEAPLPRPRKGFAEAVEWRD